MPSNIYEHFGVTPIVNAVGYASRVTGSSPHPDVIAAMAAASAQYVELDDLIEAAGKLIHKCTGAETGIITAGAGAALTLAAAACLAGNRPEIMDQLPDVSNCPRDEIIYPAAGPFDYDHAIRLSGAKLVSIEYRDADALEKIEKAINPRTAAIGYVWYGLDDRVDLNKLVELAHRHHLPAIIDAAFSMPPAENLTRFSRCGFDLIAYSGGKHLGGPQASGLLCGRADLIRSAWVQMVDMDVRSGTWSLQHWVDAGWISRSPRHGIGRSMKVSKESIVGLMKALERYGQRDHAAEYARWKQSTDVLYEGLKDLPGLQITYLKQALNGQLYPLLQIDSGTGPGAMSVRELLLALRALPRKIILAEDEQSVDRAFLYTQCFQPGDLEYTLASLRQILVSHADRVSR
ncbi:aminotransferase class V-fold PLP-dependent enzyme [Schlesneria sp. DSM 10557]|uniref:aminotransferase class V-fold PLP-dependent enzyme n=1 Tax=Schlesneria sp. DSM 10557 TaxID=3044399 RepID=UPI00359F8848